MTQLITQVASESPHGTRAIKLLSSAVGLPRATFYRRRRQTIPAAAPAESETALRQAIQRIAYNQKRLHSALGYLPPAEFEHRSSQ